MLNYIFLPNHVGGLSQKVSVGYSTRSMRDMTQLNLSRWKMNSMAPTIHSASAKVQKACKALIRAACLVRTAIQVMII